MSISNWVGISLMVLGLLPGCRESSDATEVPEGATSPTTALSAQPLAPQQPLAGQSTAAPLALGATMPSFAPLAERADPSVATVKAQIRSKRGRSIREGIGTAFVYDTKGYLLTNYHVIADATDIFVGFEDGRELEAEVVGRDQPSDVAVLKVDAKDLSALPLGDSDELRVGDWVVAIGNPFGLSHTVSAGILSAKGRTRDDVQGLNQNGYFDFLQTDASINPGNSGGPLLNLKGEVIGVNTAVKANANSIGFAIPINMVSEILPALLADGKVTRSRIGVEVAALTKKDAAALGVSTKKGATVLEVDPSGPAARAGIAANDVIIGFDGKEIEDADDLRWRASIFGVSKVAKVRLARGSRVFEVDVKLGELGN